MAGELEEHKKGFPLMSYRYRNARRQKELRQRPALEGDDPVEQGVWKDARGLIAPESGWAPGHHVVRRDFVRETAMIDDSCIY